LRPQLSKNVFADTAAPKILGRVAQVSSTYRRNFWRGREPNRPNQRDPIRSILIDFRCSNGLRDVVCAKLFRSEQYA
jgi:hypothetical protein